LPLAQLLQTPSGAPANTNSSSSPPSSPNPPAQSPPPSPRPPDAQRQEELKSPAPPRESPPPPTARQQAGQGPPPQESQPQPSPPPALSPPPSPPWYTRAGVDTALAPGPAAPTPALPLHSASSPAVSQTPTGEPPSPLAGSSLHYNAMTSLGPSAEPVQNAPSGFAPTPASPASTPQGTPGLASSPEVGPGESLNTSVNNNGAASAPATAQPVLQNVATGGASAPGSPITGPSWPEAPAQAAAAPTLQPFPQSMPKAGEPPLSPATQAAAAAPRGSSKLTSEPNGWPENVTDPRVWGSAQSPEAYGGTVSRGAASGPRAFWQSAEGYPLVAAAPGLPPRIGGEGPAASSPTAPAGIPQQTNALVPSASVEGTFMNAVGVASRGGLSRLKSSY
jgi:hypothetical protein